MTNENFNHRTWRIASPSVGLAACLVFGIVALASGDWLPGAIIVAGSTIGLLREVPEVRKLRNALRS